MAYSTGNPPRLIVSGWGSTVTPGSTSVAAAKSLWFYGSTHARADLVTAAFFTNGKDLGMRAGDVLIAPTYTTESGTGHILVFGMLTSTNSTAGWNLSTDGTMTSTFA